MTKFDSYEKQKLKRHVSVAVEASEDSEDDDTLDGIPDSLPFTLIRHIEKIEGSKTVTQSWRMKERVKVKV